MKTAAILTVLTVSALSASTPDIPLARSRSLALARSQQDGSSAYDARFTFARLRYNVTADPDFGMGRRGGYDPPWHHDYPRAEINLMHILAEVTTVVPFTEGGRIIDLGDPELFKYPIAYMSEPGYWTMTDQEAENLHNYLAKGGFIIFDDFGGRHWNNLAQQMARVWPRGRWIQMNASHPVFHVFFDINSLDAVRASYRGQPVFFGMFEDNDPKKRLIAIANYNNDIGEDWEWSGTGFEPISAENESYKFGVDYMIYGLTH